MSEYKEQTISGIAWQRGYKIVIDNKLGDTPTIIFYEEEAVQLPSGPVTHHVGQLVEPFVDPAHEYPLLNPADGTPLGATATYQQLYVMLWSLYMHLADRRDSVATAVR